MKKTYLTLLIVLVSTSILLGCTPKNSQIIGDWELDNEEYSVIRFSEDGTFSIENALLTMDGEYNLLGEDRVQFSVGHEGETTVFIAKMRIVEDRLTLTNEEDGRVDNYTRVSVGKTVVPTPSENVALLIAELEEDPDKTIPKLVEIGEPAVEPLIEVLLTGDEEESSAASTALTWIGEPAVQPLIRTLQLEYKQASIGVILGIIGDPAINPLINILDDETTNSIATITLAFGIGEPAIEPLIEALENENLRQEASNVLVMIGQPAIDPLITILIDNTEDKEKREYAGAILSNIGESSIEPLVNLLWDTDDEIKTLSVLALCEIGAPVLEVLVGYIENENTEEYRKETVFRLMEVLPGCGNSPVDQYYKKGLDYFQQENYQEAITNFSTAIDLSPNHANAYWHRARAQMAFDRCDQSIIDVTNALQFNPYIANAYWLRGLCYEKEGNIDNAIADYKQYLALSNDSYGREQVEMNLRILGATEP